MRKTRRFFHAAQGHIIAITLHGNRWRVTVNGDDVGSYETAVQAHDDVICNACFSNVDHVDTSSLGAPPDLADWASDGPK